MRKISSALFAVALAFGLSGCVLIVKEAATRLMEARTAQEQIIDAEIDIRLSNELEEISGFLLHDVNVDVWQGRVLLTGVVGSAGLREAVARLARKDTRVRAIYNEIEVDPIHSGEGGGPPRFGDVLVELAVQLRLLAAEGVRTANFHWRSVRKRIYVIGVARSAQEKKTVLRAVLGANGVASYQEFIEISPGK